MIYINGASMIIMVIRSRENLIGAWAFSIGVIISILVGFLTGATDYFRITPALIGILSIIGIIMAFFVAERDAKTFLIASVALVLVSYTGISGLIIGAAISAISIGEIMSSILQTLLAMFVPATVVVALKTMFSIANS